MKFSEQWLRQHVATRASRDELADTLTAIGLEVEELTPLGEGLDHVIVAQIVSCAKHPEADRLQVCEVDAGVHGRLQIVCGAPNARAGLKAPLAMVGAKLGEIVIKAAKLRGVESNGMLCSAKELGIDADASGLLELPADAPLGTPIAEYLGLPDATFELKLTPNRADCFGVRGIAFDVAAATGAETTPLSVEAVAPQAASELVVTLDAGADAPRYVGRVIEGVNASAPTPTWMAQRLQRSGIRPISLLVDVTQYVMLELGQPMHAFDRDLLKGPVGVRRARADETVTLLDGREAKLDDEFLVITDADRAVALAGVMGGMDTRVTDTTKNVFLEAAHFAPAAIIGRSRKLGLHTDAAHRFERGVDPDMPRIAIEYATKLIMDAAGGTPGPVSEAVIAQHLPKPTSVMLRRARLARVLGTQVADAEVERILRALGFDVVTEGDGWRVNVPARRFDIAIEEDLIEEVARIHGYDRIPTTLPGAGTVIHAPTETRASEADVRRQLAARGYLDTINFAFVEDALLQRWQMATNIVALANPLSAELAVMRPSLLPGLVDTLASNAARQQPRLRVSEIGKVFAPGTNGAAPVETLRVAAAISGDARAEQWGEAARPADFHDLKGDLDSLAALSGATLTYRAAPQPWLHPGRSAEVLREGVSLGWIGQLPPRLQSQLELDAPVYVFELDLVPLLLRALPSATGLSRFPAVRRDLAIIVGENVAWSAIEATVREAAGEVLRDFVIFDRYTGKGVDSGFKSLAMGLILQEVSRTLNEIEIEATMGRVVTALERNHGARIRG